MDPANATEDDLDRWQGSIASPAYARWQTLMIRPYYKWLQSKGYRTDNPAALLPLPRGRRRLPRPISDEKLFRAVLSAPPRVLPFLLLAGWCGLRAAEIATLRTDAFVADDHGGMWIRFTGKGNVQRDVPVPAWVYAIIQPELPADDGPCFRRAYQPGSMPLSPKNVSQVCNRHLDRQGIPDRLHSLRHRVATATLHDSQDLRLVQDLLGHASLATLHVYTKVQSQEMAAAVDRLPRPPLRLVPTLDVESESA